MVKNTVLAFIALQGSIEGKQLQNYFSYFGNVSQFKQRVLV